MSQNFLSQSPAPGNLAPKLPASPAQALSLIGKTVAWFTRNNHASTIGTARLVHEMSDIASAAYNVRAVSDAEGWRTVSDVVPFDGELFNGFVRVDPTQTVVSIRGTHYDKDDPKGLWNVVKQWLRNIDARQVELNDCRIHGGYHKELEHMYPRIVELLKHHHRDKKRPLYITGHSAGAGLATLVGYRLAKEHGDALKPAKVVAFASPKVGDDKFQQTYPVPLLRIERGTDLVPVLPFGSEAKKVISYIGADKLASTLTRPLLKLFDVDPDRAGGLLATDYAHAGTMLYYSADADPSLVSARSTLQAPFVYLGQRLASSYGLSRELPIQYRPQLIVRFERMKDIFEGVKAQLSSLSGGGASAGLGFIRDHGVDLTSQYLAALTKKYSA